MNAMFLFSAIDGAADTLSSMAEGLASDTPVEKTQTIWDMIQSGGWSGMVIIGILFIMSIISIYLFAERTSAINRESKVDVHFINNIKMLISEGKLKQAKILCAEQNTAVSRLISKGIDRIGKPLEDISSSIENSGKQEVFTLESGISRLAMISGVGPMLGFLGTVVGMVIAFQQMANAGGQVEILDLSGGISTAMTTTVAGLIVGIMAYIFYNLLVVRINKVINQIEVSTTEFLDLLSEPAGK
ncbi:MAG: MotA/TolQ/ExbB proton channel family protein [Flavobacteriales bacterium]|nr:MotA/TolQ/ExbB proton channel family protein [Flavobacteriales bacterium]